MTDMHVIAVMIGVILGGPIIMWGISADCQQALKCLAGGHSIAQRL